MPVKKDDVLEIPEEIKWKIIPVVWKHHMKEYNKNYYRVDFTNINTTDTEKTNFLFVSEEKLDTFKTSKIQKTDKGFKLTVDDDYQYGQQKGDKNRFLVYHDKQRVIFQHRFAEGTIAAIARQATDISGKMGYGDVKLVSGVLAGLVGNELHNY